MHHEIKASICVGVHALMRLRHEAGSDALQRRLLFRVPSPPTIGLNGRKGVFMIVRIDLCRPVPATPILVAIVMMTVFDGCQGRRTGVTDDMLREIAAAVFVAAFQGVIGDGGLEQTDGQTQENRFAETVHDSSPDKRWKNSFVHASFSRRCAIIKINKKHLLKCKYP
ncbi:MAG TPA: hypothetical protein PK018_00745 [Candidatus Competibacter sp.]|nr:hypothetical protein [Candidatus Competibacteraceae bacterium]HPE70689.1 hypothetical protein [Candidatus Competibacter sp.]